MKVCTKCKTSRDLEEFSKDKRTTDGLCFRCKNCVKEYNLKHVEEIHKRHRQYYLSNKEKVKSYSKKHKEERRKYMNNYIKRRYNEDAEFKLASVLRSRLRGAIGGKNKSASTTALLGCSIEELKQRLSRQFQEDMTWENYGEWHIDHVKPCAAFDLTKEAEQKECFHYTNLQPLWAEDNLKKGSKFYE